MGCMKLYATDQRLVVTVHRREPRPILALGGLESDQQPVLLSIILDHLYAPLPSLPKTNDSLVR